MKNDLHRFVKFCIVGALGTLVNLSILYFQVEYLGIWYIVGAVISFIVASVFNFTLDKIWTFKNKEKSVLKQYVKFIAVSMIGVCINLITLYVLVEFFNLWYIFAQILAIGSATIWNFMGSKTIVFRGVGE